MLERFSIRWRLALITAGLTFLVLLGFALAVGKLTNSRLRSDFNRQTASAATTLSQVLTIKALGNARFAFNPSLSGYAGDAAIRLYFSDRARTPVPDGATLRGPRLGLPVRAGSTDEAGYRVATRRQLVPALAAGVAPTALPIWLQYARPLDDLNRTLARVRLFLGFGVIAGTWLALLLGAALARRAIRPITSLTATAQEIARTADPDRRVPLPRADDEVAELARTFDEMLTALEAARRETEGALQRQREFIADASHELRTPLTSVLANLELLEHELEGESLEGAQSALRSARRMRRLVADLLLLTRTDNVQERPMVALDLSEIARDAVAEAGALAQGHTLRLLVGEEPVPTVGARDELHRMILNLVENAIHHTPPGSTIEVATGVRGPHAIVVVSDDGPGVPEEHREQIFDRFYRASGDRGRSTGLGLAIVQAVAEGHGGLVTLEHAAPGARFIVRLPATSAAALPEPGDLETAVAVPEARGTWAFAVRLSRRRS